MRLRYALALRCPNCGHRPIAGRRAGMPWGELVPACPSCGYVYEREEGYWVGAMIVNLGVAMALFVAILLLGLLATWPDVPWNLLTIVAAVAMAIAPVVVYPRSKTVWVWVDRRLHPYEADERDPGERTR